MDGMGIGTCDGTKVSAKPQMEVVLEDIGRSVITAEKALDELEARVGPVLRAKQPPQGGELPAAPIIPENAVLLVKVFSQKAFKISQLAKKIKDIRQRIEV